MKKFQNSKANGRFNSAVVKWGSLAIIALLALLVLPAIAAHPETFPILGLGCFMPMGFGRRRGLMLFDAPKEGGGGGMSAKDFQDTVLKGLEGVRDKQKAIEETLAKAPNPEEFSKLQKEFDDLMTQVKEIRKAALSWNQTRSHRRAGEVSEDCAKMLGAIAVARALRKGQLTDSGDRLKGLCEEILGKAALTTAEVPLPTAYSGEVVELVATYGTARRFGTVFPLPAGTFKLPKLTTDPAFGLIAMSAAISQKAPAFGWVTFAAEKWGGLVILPNELDEDSIVAVGQFVARYAARQMAKIEDIVFWSADGSGTYDNLSGLQKLVVDNAKIVTLGGGLTHHADIQLADLRSVRATVDSPALQMGRYFMHPSFEQFLCGLNSDGDKPYVANGANGATLDGFRIEWVDVLPAFSASANAAQVPVIFGDVSYHYLGTRGGMRFDQSDAPGFATDQLYIRALERFTTGLMADGAVGGLKLADA